MKRSADIKDAPGGRTQLFEIRRESQKDCPHCEIVFYNLVCKKRTETYILGHDPQIWNLNIDIKFKQKFRF